MPTTSPSSDPAPDGKRRPGRSAWVKKGMWLAGILGVAAALFYGYLRHHYPYGHTHRCSKILAMHLEEYAADHGGNYPRGDDPSHLGLGQLIEYDPENSGSILELVVGKAGDLDRAREFHARHGYLLPEHSSWHYVTGRSAGDADQPLAWDKIPLSHNGKRLSSNPREVIMVGGYVQQVNQADWSGFLIRHKEPGG